MTPINPYISEADADIYFATRLDVEAWEDADSSTRAKALASATEMINLLPYVGEKAGGENDNMFPLDYQLEVPENVQKACCEIALELLEGHDSFKDFKDLKVRAEGYSSVRVSYESDFLVYQELYGLNSFRAYKLLLPWLAMPAKTITLNRV